MLRKFAGSSGLNSTWIEIEPLMDGFQLHVAVMGEVPEVLMPMHFGILFPFAVNVALPCASLVAVMVVRVP